MSMFDDDIPVKIFTSYSHRDEALREELDVALAMIKRQKAVEIWNDRDIEAGEEWDTEIKKEFDSADIILLLFSPRFLASRYVYEVEMANAIKRHEEGTARVIPIILKKCDWKATEFKKLQAVPKNSKPIVTWDDMDEALYDVATQLKRVIKSVQAKKKKASE